MKRWNCFKNELVENPKIDIFLADLWKVCEQHGMSIAHEDGHGAFLVEDISDENKSWLFGANDQTHDIVEKSNG